MSVRQGELLPSWEHYPFATNRPDSLALVESEHRQHAVVELAIGDLKDQALAHFPSSSSKPKRPANSAGSITPAFVTARSSSKTTTADSFTMRVTS